MAVAMTSGHSALLDARLRKVYDEAAKIEQAMKSEEIFNYDTSERNYEIDYIPQAFGEGVVKNEQDTVNYVDYLEGFTKTYTHVTYSIATKISMELAMDDLWNKIKGIPANLRISMKSTQETQVMSLLNGTSALTPDGVALFTGTTNGHLNKQGGAVLGSKNLYASTPLSPTALIQAYTTLQRTLTDQGLKSPLEPAVLVVGPELAETAYAITAGQYSIAPAGTALSGTTVNPAAQNAKNFWQGMLRVVVTPWLSVVSGAAYPWIVLSAKEFTGLNVINRMNPTLEIDTDFDTKCKKLSVVSRFSYGASHWRGAVKFTS